MVRGLFIGNMKEWFIKKKRESSRERKSCFKRGVASYQGFRRLGCRRFVVRFWAMFRDVGSFFCMCAMDISFLLYHVVRLFPYLLHCSFGVNIFGLNVLNQGSVTLLQTNSAERKSLLYPLICFRVDWDLGVLESIVVFQSGKCQLKFRRRKKKRLDFSGSHFCSKEILCEE